MLIIILRKTVPYICRIIQISEWSCCNMMPHFLKRYKYTCTGKNIQQLSYIYFRPIEFGLGSNPIWMLRSYWLVLRMRSPLSSSVSLPATPTGHVTPELSGSPASGSPGAYRRPLPATPTGHVTLEQAGAYRRPLPATPTGHLTPGTSRQPPPALARSPLTPPASQATKTEVLFSLP
jgi:hypothetical protein